MVDDHDLEGIESEIAEIQKLTDSDFCLIAIKVNDWNRDLSPWKAPAVFGKEDFGGGAEETLQEVLKYCTDREKHYIIGGYSLAGLFALWAAYQTDVFSGVAAASPSVWFQGFTDYMKENTIHSNIVYLSLGDKEERARNPLMAQVGNCIRRQQALLSAQGIHTILEWNPGNHFQHSDTRTAHGFAWVVNEGESEERK
jgi:predicted alpha/beta superfamily hydrolase